MKRTRGLWASIAFVLVLTLASVVGLVTGALQPILGLDLEGGVSVTLSAPDGTPAEVMDRARTNISNRVDAFGVGEPDIVVSGNTIEVQIPGLGQGTIEQRAETRWCLVGPDDENYGCAETEQAANEALAELTVVPQVAEACLVDGSGAQAECFPSEELARLGKRAITVAPRADASPVGPTPERESLAASPAAGGFCLVSTTGEQLDCFPTRKEAEAARDALTVEVTQETFCVTDGAREPMPKPSPRPPPRRRLRPSASASPSAAPTAFSEPDLGGDRSPVRAGVEGRGPVGHATPRRCARSTRCSAW